MSSTQVLSSLRSTVYGACALWFGLYFIPTRIGAVGAAVPGQSSGAGGWRMLGAVPLILGAALCVVCVYTFAWKGRGTPAPFDPPRRLVISGPYGFVRNPMYWGFGGLYVGEAFLFSHSMRMATLYATILACIAGIMVPWFEEHILRRMFGEEYAEYCRNVPRWWPRLHAWRPSPATHQDIR